MLETKRLTDNRAINVLREMRAANDNAHEQLAKLLVEQHYTIQAQAARIGELEDALLEDTRPHRVVEDSETVRDLKAKLAEVEKELRLERHRHRATRHKLDAMHKRHGKTIGGRDSVPVRLVAERAARLARAARSHVIHGREAVATNLLALIEDMGYAGWSGKEIPPGDGPCDYYIGGADRRVPRGWTLIEADDKE